MPPSAVKTVEDLIFWQYAKIISKSAGMGKKNYGFIMERFKKLQSGEIEWSTSIREYVRESERKDECIYCGEECEDLTLEHILPLSRGGPDTPDNAVHVCQSCNSRKGSKRPYEWFYDEYDFDKAKYDMPRIAEGKYLKLLHKLHEENGTLDLHEDELERLCDQCDLGSKCPEEETLSPLCLEGVFRK
ncbi:HNH endonuclease [candidate division MSBL1 archaeon SCGC-AAA259O05]|uniref:HNH endonuclease n=1 Tax=candidate division MSBL1 archaeon SCGC-AAA259O05 TaxID=1698271 RepID=A0A133V0Z5_9EURY|nr:HNH endonuclease [candidate division MSBL1 archaeon SCGC-AAA259O05]